MAEEEKNLPQQPDREQDREAKNVWQIQKESWYDKIPLNVKQMDTIIAICWVALAVTAILIYLDVKDIFHLFG